MFCWLRRVSCVLLVTSALAVASDQLALRNVTVIDGTGTPPKAGLTVLITDGRISDVFASRSRKLSSSVKVLDLTGKYLIPGLIDSHYHLLAGMRSAETEEAFRRFAFLGGITTVRSMADDAVALAELAKHANESAVESPRIYFAALFGGPSLILKDRRIPQISHGRLPGEAPWARAITASTDITQAVADAKATGATGVKIYSDLTPDLIQRITNEAHRQGLRVWAHAAVYPSRPRQVVAAGVDVVSHSMLMVSQGMQTPPETYLGSYILLDYGGVSYAASEFSALLKDMLERGTMLDATLLVVESLRKSTKGATLQDPEEMATWSYMMTQRAHIRRIPILAGTDLQETPREREFPNLHAELELLVREAGMTPIEALTAATRNGAIGLGIDSSYGTIEKGKVADLVVLSADPSRDIRNSTSIVYIIKAGTVHRRERVKLP